MDKLKKIAATPKRVATHVYERRGRYTFVVGVVAGGYIMRGLDKETYQEAMAFLELKGLRDEFFRGDMEHDWSELVAMQ